MNNTSFDNNSPAHSDEEWGVENAIDNREEAPEMYSAHPLINMKAHKESPSNKENQSVKAKQAQDTQQVEHGKIQVQQ